MQGHVRSPASSSFSSVRFSDLRTASSINQESSQQPNVVTAIVPEESKESAEVKVIRRLVTASKPVETNFRGRTQSSSSSGVNGQQIQYTSPGQRVRLNFGSQSVETARSTRHTGNSKKSTGNTLDVKQQTRAQVLRKAQSQTNKRVKVENTKQRQTITTEKPATKIITTTTSTTASTTTTAKLMTKNKVVHTTIKSSDRFDTTEVTPSDETRSEETNKSSEQISTEVTTIRPLRLRPVARRPGARRRIRPRNRLSTFNPRTHNRNVRKQTTAVVTSTTPVTTTTLKTTTSNRKAIKETKKVYSDDGILEVTTTGSGSPESEKLT